MEKAYRALFLLVIMAIVSLNTSYAGAGNLNRKTIGINKTAKVTKIGKVGNHPIFKVETALVLASAGDLINGCRVVVSGLDCDQSPATEYTDAVSEYGLMLKMLKERQQEQVAVIPIFQQNSCSEEIEKANKNIASLTATIEALEREKANLKPAEPKITSIQDALTETAWEPVFNRGPRFLFTLSSQSTLYVRCDRWTEKWLINKLPQPPKKRFVSETGRTIILTFAKPKKPQSIP